MDAFFVHQHDFTHPYPVKQWTVSTYEDMSYLLTFDGVKFRLYNFLLHKLLKECDFISHETLALLHPIYTPLYPSKAIFLMVKNRRNLIAFDDTLRQVPTMSLDTKIIVLAMSWSPKFQTLYLSGNFGWMRALEVHAHTSISGTAAEWEGKWTTRHNSQWMNQLVCDDVKEILFGASGTDVYIMSMKDGSLLQKFGTGHKANISGISYSPEHLMFFTAATDGIVKTWQVFEKSALNTQTIDQVRLGPIHIVLDSLSIITVSHERVIRRYNMMTGNLIGSYNLEPSVPLDMKDVESVIDLQSAITHKTETKSWVFQSEGGVIRQFQACFAPKELSICSDTVVSILVDNHGKIFALSKNNIIHQLYADTHESTVFDLDTMPVANTGKPHTISVPVSSMVLHKGIIYVGFSNGEIKCFNTTNKQLFEMNEPTLGNRIDSMLPMESVMTVRHSYCKKCKRVTTLLFTSTSNGGIVMHCPTCWDYIGSWKISNIGMLHMERTPNGKYVVGLEDVVIHIYRVGEASFDELFSLKLDEFEIGQTFVFATQNLLVVCLDNGKGKVYELVEDLKGNPSLVLLHNMKLHNSAFTSIISSMDLLKFEGGQELIAKEQLEGFVVSLGTNDTLTIANCITGLVQYTKDTPKHTTNHEMAFLYTGKLMIVLGVDQNIRLLDWPEFVRVYPSPPHTPKKEEEEEKKEIPSEEEDEDIVASGFFAQTTNTLKAGYFSSSASSSSTDMLSDSSSVFNQPTVVQDPPLRYPDIPPGGRKRMDLVFENGHPKIIVEGEETYTFNIDSRPSVGELFTATQKDADAVMEHNTNIIKKLIANDPRVAAAFAPQKKIKRISKKKVEEVDEEFFYNFFLTVDVKSVPKEVFRQMREQRKSKQGKKLPITPSQTSSQASTQRSQINEDENDEDEEYVQRIKPIKIGNRKKRDRQKRKARIFEIEMEDGTIVQTNELTAEILEQLANPKVDDPTRAAYNASGINVPGKIFQKALQTLKKHEEKKSQPIIHLTQQVATPIQTLMPNGVSIGGSEARHFHNIKPTYYNDFIGPRIPKKYSQSMSGSDFMHWEGVKFHNRPVQGHIKNISLSEQFLDLSPGYEEEEEEEETLESIQKRRNFVDNIFGRRGQQLARIEEYDSAVDEFDPSGYVNIEDELFPDRKKPKEEQHREEEDTFGEPIEPFIKPSSGNSELKASSAIQLINNTNLFDNRNDSSASLFSMQGLNIFDNNNSRAQKLVENSPSLKILNDIYGGSDNPLADLIKNAPPVSSDDLKSLNLNRLGPLPEWTPLADTIPMESSGIPQDLKGFTVAGYGNAAFGKGRPRSPPSGLFTLNDINNSLNVGKNFLPSINESSSELFDLGAIPEGSIMEENDLELLDSPASTEGSILVPPKSPKVVRPKSASVVQVEEHLKRNDFKALKEVLEDVGLIEDETLIEQPKWQPTVNFLSFHQKTLSNNSSTISLLDSRRSAIDDDKQSTTTGIPEEIPENTEDNPPPGTSVANLPDIIDNLPAQVSSASRGSFSSLPYEATNIEDSDGSMHSVSGVIEQKKPEIKLPESPKFDKLGRNSSSLNSITELEELDESQEFNNMTIKEDEEENLPTTIKEEEPIIKEEGGEKQDKENIEEEDEDVDIDGEIHRLREDEERAQEEAEEQARIQREQQEAEERKRIEEEEEEKRRKAEEEKQKQEEEEEYVEEDNYETETYTTETNYTTTDATSVTEVSKLEAEEEEEEEEKQEEGEKIEEKQEKTGEEEEKAEKTEENKEEKVEGKVNEEEEDEEEELYSTTSDETETQSSEVLSNLNKPTEEPQETKPPEEPAPELEIPKQDPLITITSHRSQSTSGQETPKLQIAEEIGDIDLAKMKEKQAKKRPPRSRNNEKVEKNDRKLSKGKKSDKTGSRKSVNLRKSQEKIDLGDTNNKLISGITMESIQSDNEEEEDANSLVSKSKEIIPIVKDPVTSTTKLSKSNRGSAKNSTSNMSVESTKPKAVAGNRLGQGKQRRTIGRRASEARFEIDNTISSITEEEVEHPDTPKKKVVKKKIVKKEEPNSPLINKKDLQRIEEEELLAKLMANTTEMDVSSDLSSILGTGHSDKSKIMKMKERKNDKSLSSRITLDDEPESFKILDQREAEEKAKEKFPNFTIIRNKSSNDLLTKKLHDRPRMRMLNEYETSIAPTCFTSFYGLSLWDRKQAKLRRNSVIW